MSSKKDNLKNGHSQNESSTKIWQVSILRYNVSMRSLGLLIILFISHGLWASPAEEPLEDSIPILDSVARFLESNANSAANRLDSFFANERADDELGRSRIRLRSSYSLREKSMAVFDQEYRINLKLPSLEKKFRFNFLKNKKQISKNPTPQAPAPSQSPILSDTDLWGKLKYGWIFNSDVNVSAAIPPRLTTRARVRNTFQTGKFIHRFADQLIYVTDESGLINEVRIESDQIINENEIFRFINYMRWKIFDKSYLTQHGPTLLHRISDNQAFNTSFLSTFIHNNGVAFLNNYSLSFNYRRNIYRQWFFMDVVPGLDFPKDQAFRRTPFIFLQIELLFGS